MAFPDDTLHMMDRDKTSEYRNEMFIVGNTNHMAMNIEQNDAITFDDANDYAHKELVLKNSPSPPPSTDDWEEQTKDIVRNALIDDGMITQMEISSALSSHYTEITCTILVSKIDKEPRGLKPTPEPEKRAKLRIIGGNI